MLSIDCLLGWPRAGLAAKSRRHGWDDCAPESLPAVVSPSVHSRHGREVFLRHETDLFYEVQFVRYAPMLD